MTSAGRPAGLMRDLHEVLGTPGLMIAGVSVLAFAFGLAVTWAEYGWLRDTERDTLRAVVASWVRTLPVDYLGLTLADDVDDWQRAQPADRGARRVELQRSLTSLGMELDLHAERYPLITVVALELAPRGQPVLARWQSSTRPLDSASKLDHVPVVSGAAGQPIELTAWYRLSPELERSARGLEISYHRLLLALLGLSGYSLLCLVYMVLHARALREQVAHEAAQEATLGLADRTCHELGNVVFVLGNEQRNLADHLDKVEQFVNEQQAVWRTAVERVGLDQALADRFARVLRQEFSERGIDPSQDLLASTALARDVCRQIEVCSDYIALTVRELDSYLKQSALPVQLGPIDVEACFDDALALLSPRLDAAGASVEREPAGSTRRFAQGDRRLLVHALVNLIKNAVEACSGHGVEPRIRLATAVDDHTVWISVADNGPGVPTGDLPRLFDLRYSTKGAGRGRGLAIVRESVLDQKGELRVTSRPGSGAEFRIGLPSAADSPA